MEQLNDLIPDDFGITNTESISAEDLQQISGAVFGVNENPDNIVDLQQPVTTQPPVKNPENNVVENKDKIDEDSLLNDVLGNNSDTNSEDENLEDVNQNQNQNSKEDEEVGFDYNALAKDLFQLGIFNQEDDEDIESLNSPEDLKNRFVKELQNQANSTIYNIITEKHGEEGLEAFRAIFVNGVNPQEYLEKYSQIQTASELDLTKESNQEKVLRMYYKSLDWEDSEIEDEIQLRKDYGDLDKKAELVHKKLIASQEKELQQLEQQKIQQQKLAQKRESEYRQNLDAIIKEKVNKREFDGIPVNNKLGAEAFHELTEPRYQLPNGEKLTEFDKYILELKRPENLPLKLKWWLLAKHNFDFSKIKQQAVSKKEDELFNNLAVKDKSIKRTTKLPQNNLGFGKYL